MRGALLPTQRPAPGGTRPRASRVLFCRASAAAGRVQQHSSSHGHSAVPAAPQQPVIELSPAAQGQQHGGLQQQCEGVTPLQAQQQQQHHHHHHHHQRWQQRHRQQRQDATQQQQQPGDSSSNGPGALAMSGGQLPGQADQLWGDPSDRESRDVALVEPTTKSVSDLDYLSELLAIQQNDGPKNLGFFGTRNMGMTHQKLVEILSYAMVSSGNHIYTSGATGTNAAVIKGALRAEAPDLLTVILPQSLSRQPQESQELLAQVTNIIEMPHNDELSLLEASRHCNREIIGKVQQVICFAFHDSRLLLETCAEAKDSKKIVTLFYLD